MSLSIIQVWDFKISLWEEIIISGNFTGFNETWGCRED